MPDRSRSFRGTTVAALLLCGMAACSAPPPAPAPVPTPVVVQLSPEEVYSVAQLIRIEDRREYDEGTLARLAGDPSSEVRRRTALALGRLRLAEGLPLLEQLLEDGDTAIAATAAFALGQVGDTAAVPSLIEVLGDESPDRASVAAEAAAALGKLQSGAAADALRAMLAESPLDVQRGTVVHEALLAIWRHPRSPDPSALLRWTEAANPELRWRAAYALTRRPEPAATRPLLRLVDDTDARVRANAVRGLTGPMADSAGVPRHSVEAVLLSSLEDEDYATRINAARSLGTLGTPASIHRLEALLDSDPTTTLVAIESLGRSGASAARAIPRLASIASDASTPLGNRIAALAAVVQLDSGRGAELADALGQDSAWRVRAAAGRALAQHGPADRSSLLSLLRDPDPRVVAATIGAAGDAVPTPRVLLVESLTSPDVGVRTAALRGLARSREPAMLPLILDAYAAALADRSSDARLAAIDALAALHESGTPAENAFFRRFGRPDDYLVRLRAERSFGSAARERWGESLPIDTGRSMSDYRRLTAEHVQHPLSGDPYPRVLLRTDAGEVLIELFSPDAPLTVESFLRLADAGYFDGQEWPRVVPNFVVQGGDPRGDQTGGPGYAIRDEINRHRHETGTVGMAHSGPDTGGSQFFITHSPQPHLDGGYTVFGQVVRGHDVVERIGVGDRILSLRRVDESADEHEVSGNGDQRE